MLSWTIYCSLLGALGLLLLPRDDAHSARAVALLASLAGLACAVIGTLQAPAGLFTITDVEWVHSLGIRYHLAADGISLTLVILTGLASVTGILFSWNIAHRTKEFFALYLALIGGVYGVFLSFDLFTLFVFYELAIIPKYFLVAICGSTRKEYGAMKLVLYSFVGSALVLIGIVAAYVVAGGKSFDLFELAKFSFPENFQVWAFPLVFVGFAFLAGLWPFHTWAPTGHVAAPTAASMLLAGVVMKLGAYGCLRVAMTLFQLGLKAWQSPLALLAVIGIVYGAMVALTQRDFKFVIGYSSVSHMGFVLLGLATLNVIGLSGAVLQMFSHGIIAGLLFGVVGRMVYDRTHTRELTVLEGMGLLKAMPFAAVTFAIAAVASMGLPGFSGFVAEFQVLIGAWKSLPGFTVAAGVGIVIGVAYTMRALQKAFFPDTADVADDVSRRNHDAPDESASSRQRLHDEHEMEPISIPERLGAVLLIGTSLFIGLYPRILLDMIVPSFDSPLFDAMRKGGAL
ncbi:MAG: NADH-quinone oxidoreductase subunit M [Verrucomicrobia bacterium]|nr:NADH-quinone oxidoreductase subunit M [Verrucomicrobiota bacterium]